jgi:hypothetical protein
MIFVDTTLRKKLVAMTDADTEDQYLELFAAAIQNHPNAVTRLYSAHPIGRYTCFVHVFGFTEKPEYVAIARWGFNGQFAGPEFAHWMIDHQELKEVSEAEAQPGDMVMYFNDEGRLKHTGIYLGVNRVESKWGKGHLFEHDLFAVPESYGTTVKYFRKIPGEDVLESFKQFAREKGMFID